MQNDLCCNLSWVLSQFYWTTVVVLGFYVPPTAKVIRRWDLGLKSHPKDWRSPRTSVISKAVVKVYMRVCL